MTRVYKLEVLIVDHDDLGPDGVREVLEGVRYPNRCISPQIVSIEQREVEWSDEHPLNQRRTWRETFATLFGRSPGGTP